MGGKNFLIYLPPIFVMKTVGTNSNSFRYPKSYITYTTFDTQSIVGE
jgi:hypothetical protein